MIAPENVRRPAVDCPDLFAFDPAAKRPAETVLELPGVVNPLKEVEVAFPRPLDGVGEALDRLFPVVRADGDAEDQQAPRFEHPEHFTGRGGISVIALDVLEDAHGIDDVKRPVPVGKAAGVADPEGNAPTGSPPDRLPGFFIRVEGERADVRQKKVNRVPAG